MHNIHHVFIIINEIRIYTIKFLDLKKLIFVQFDHSHRLQGR